MVYIGLLPSLMIELNHAYRRLGNGLESRVLGWNFGGIDNGW